MRSYTYDRYIVIEGYVVQSGEGCEGLAREIQAVYPTFDSPSFIQQVLSRFPELELKARIGWICEMLHKYLPADYPKALKIIIASLPKENSADLSDNDFGDFIYAPYGEFVAQYGCTSEYLERSLEGLQHITMRFSAEDAIRCFINAFPTQTLRALTLWSAHRHYHVRRLVSEGTLPKLPWCIGITMDPALTIPLLDRLYCDNARKTHCGLHHYLSKCTR